MSTNRFFLFTDLTETKGNYPVTELSKLLIQAIGHDVCSSRWNTHSLYSLVTRARDICNTINELLPKVNQDASWTVFDQCTGMITSLEDALFDFSIVESQETDTVQKCLQSIATWEKNRKGIRDTIQSLNAEIFKPVPGRNESNLAAIYKHDDNALFLALCQGMRSGMSGPRLEILKKLEKIQDNVATTSETLDDIVVMGIQTTMLMNGMMTLLNTSKDAGLLKVLQSTEVWREFQKLLSAIDGHVDNRNQVFTKEWDAFLLFLEAKGVAVQPPSFLALRSLISSIRRPYYARSVALVRACVDLEPHSTDDDVADILKPLTTALDAAGKLPSPYRADATFEVNADVDSKFATALRSLEECYKKCKPDSWSTVNANIEAACQKDEARLNRLGEMLSGKTIPLKRENEVTLIVNARPGGTLVPPFTYTVEPSISLNAILWKEASRLNLCDRLHEARFEQSKKTLRLDTKVSEVMDSAGKRAVVTLFLPA